MLFLLQTHRKRRRLLHERRALEYVHDQSVRVFQSNGNHQER